MMGTARFAVQVRSTIPTGVADEIQRQIANGQLKEGDRLPSVEALARDFGVSRTSIREALHGLAALGIVEIHHGRGTFIRDSADRVHSSTTWIREQQYQLQELCELRLAVETTAARLAAVKASAEEIEAIEDALAHFRDSTDDLGQVVSWDTTFHRCVISAAHNRLLEQALALSNDYLTEARFRMHSLPGEVDRSISAHERIVEAIRQRDPSNAALAMREHLRSVEEDLGISLP
jgi:GntR family transcriptional repressor for pyruvate dehydrogenase complex